VDELRLLGARGSLERSIFEVRRRSGLDRVVHPIQGLDVEHYRRTAGAGDPGAAPHLQREWAADEAGFRIPRSQVARPHVRALVGDPGPMLDRAARIARGGVWGFRSQWFEFGSPPDWRLNPETGDRWPHRHSSAAIIGADTRPLGDIKLNWELGRFQWAVDLVRAWLVDDDPAHLDLLFDWLESFRRDNPLLRGPHWSSEQEIAIRALMLLWVRDVLRDSPRLTPERLTLLHAVLWYHGRGLDTTLGRAESGIRNNHLIHGALGLYALGLGMPWLPEAQPWSRRGRRLLLEAELEQWTDDGGYVQPSHNYHRSAWHGMLWALGVARVHGDAELEGAIQRRIPPSLDLFAAHVDPSTGSLPNWGANDGALIGVWTECAFTDFRPVLNSMAHAIGRPLVFPAGPWDEELLWLFGPAALEADRSPAFAEEPGDHRFWQQGLWVDRAEPSRYAVLRAGTIRSRYGQQADQLHVDLFVDGTNLALDSGSFNYNKSFDVHNWFRGTRSHNTVLVGGADQMVPHRTFKYLQWTHTATWEPEDHGLDYARIAAHDGYLRLPGSWLHTRMLARLGATWCVVDRVAPTGRTAPRTPVSLHWQLADLPHTWDEGSSTLTLEMPEGSADPRWTVTLGCTDSAFSAGLARASSEPLDGWHSRSYNHRDPALALSLDGSTSEPVWFVTLLGPEPLPFRLEGDPEPRTLHVEGRPPVDLRPMITRAYPSELTDDWIPPSPLTPTQEALKRGLDVGLASAGLVGAAPVIGAAWAVARLDTRAGGFFVQERVGRYGRPFSIVKVRTMRDAGVDASTVTVGNDARITPSGRVIRRFKIDELPQLLNVLWGEMSFVGPRPDVPGYADVLEGEDRVILAVRPGITGPAALKYRDEEQLMARQSDPERFNREVVWPDKVSINRDYLEDYSISRDLLYVLRTLLGR